MKKIQLVTQSSIERKLPKYCGQCDNFKSFRCPHDGKTIGNGVRYYDIAKECFRECYD
jgi:hypothetical protein